MLDFSNQNNYNITIQLFKEQKNHQSLLTLYSFIGANRSKKFQRAKVFFNDINSDSKYHEQKKTSMLNKSFMLKV